MIIQNVAFFFWNRTGFYHKIGIIGQELCVVNIFVVNETFQIPGKLLYFPEKFVNKVIRRRSLKKAKVK